MKILIVVDMQNDFITGSLGTKEAQAIIPNVIEKIKECEEREDHIIFTQDTHYFNYMETHEGKLLPIEHCISDTWGWEIPEEIDNKECKHYCKRGFGSFAWGREFCNNCLDIELIGVCTDICVISNALILRSDFTEANITVDASCCAGTTPERHKAALEVMKSCQINVIGEDNI